jgi:phenylalanyl-tRNA synthetase beta chain
MTSLGLMEARTLPLGPGDGAKAQPVLNPLSAEEGYLRTALLPGLVRAAERNWAASQRDIRLFEIGTVFAKSDDGPRPVEQLAMAGIVTGARSPAHWADTPKSVDFDLWDVKCLLAEAGAAIGPLGAIEASADGWEWRDQSGRVRGWAGPLDADSPPWAGSLFGFEVEIVDAPRGTVEFKELPQTPPAQRDLALVVPGGVSARAIEEVIKQRGGQHLESVEVFDEYRGKEIAGRSVAWRLVFRSPHRTLRDKDVDGAVSKVLNALQEQLGVERRKA